MAQNDISIRALAIVNEERSIHGLRFGDYARYRRHCSNKIHRLRQALKLTHGKGKNFKKPPEVLTENLKDGHLLLDLFEAERAWAYAQELLLESTKTQNTPVRRHALSRFRKALQWAKELSDRSSILHSSSPQRISHTAHTEVTAYYLMLRGRFERTKDEFEAALSHLAVSRSILDALTNSATSSRDQALYAVFIDEVNPEIRYCAHQIGRAKAYDIDAIVAELAPKDGPTLVPGYGALLDAVKTERTASTSASGTLEPFMWEGEPVPVRSPELVDALLKVQHAIKQLESGGKKKSAVSDGSGHAKASRVKIAAFDGVLSTLSDAESVARKLAESQQSNASLQAGSGAAGTRDAHFIHAFVSYQLLAHRIQRDLLLAEALTQPQASPVKLPSSTSSEGSLDPRVYPAVIKNLDTVLQSLEQMRTLSITDESPEVSSAIDARLSFTRAKRCRYISLAHASVKNYAQSVALNSRAEIHLREGTSSGGLDPSTPAPAEVAFFYPLDNAVDVEALSKELELDAIRLKKDWFAFNGGTVSTEAESGSKKHRKPLFFDIAFNYVESPMERINERAGKAVAERAEKPTTAPKAKVDKEDEDEKKDEEEEGRRSPVVSKTAAGGGITGFLGGWWGRR
ncbi:hypothetical protein FRC04_003923 [Tulasnella sp. 424]|nr:hypothetical protein FRC04_003923 [Tulasnella sp. 424]KAG8964678.1 hypothetical protein FRC05_003637 [Tulasnella sp. 425]